MSLLRLWLHNLKGIQHNAITIVSTPISCLGLIQKLHIWNVSNCSEVNIPTNAHVALNFWNKYWTSTELNTNVMLLKTNTPDALSIAQTRYEAYASHGTDISIIITCSVETKVSCVNYITLVWDPQCLLSMQILFIFLFYCSLCVSTETVFFILMISTNTPPGKDHHHHHHQVQSTHFS